MISVAVVDLSVIDEPVSGEVSESSLQPLLSFSSSVVLRDPAQGPVATLKKSCVTFILASRWTLEQEQSSSQGGGAPKAFC